MRQTAHSGACLSMARRAGVTAYGHVTAGGQTPGRSRRGTSMQNCIENWLKSLNKPERPDADCIEIQAKRWTSEVFAGDSQLSHESVERRPRHSQARGRLANDTL